jgi:hypothetical protein
LGGGKKLYDSFRTAIDGLKEKARAFIEEFSIETIQQKARQKII